MFYVERIMAHGLLLWAGFAAAAAPPSTAPASVVPAVTDSAAWADLTPMELAAVQGIERARAGDGRALLDLALAISGDVRERQLAAPLIAKIDAFLEVFGPGLMAESDHWHRGYELFRAMHLKLLAPFDAYGQAGYSLHQTKLSTVLQTGVFNCISSAVLYTVLARRVGLDVQGVLLPSHAFAQITLPDGTVYDIETTNPEGFGVVHDARFYGSEKAAKWAKEHTLEPTSFADYQRREIVPPHELLGRNGLTQHTHAGKMSDTDRARIRQIAALLSPDDDAVMRSALAGRANRLKTLVEAGQFEEVLRLSKVFAGQEASWKLAAAGDADLDSIQMSRQLSLLDATIGAGKDPVPVLQSAWRFATKHLPAKARDEVIGSLAFGLGEQLGTWEKRAGSPQVGAALELVGEMVALLGSTPNPSEELRQWVRFVQVKGAGLWFERGDLARGLAALEAVLVDPGEGTDGVNNRVRALDIAGQIAPAQPKLIGSLLLRLQLTPAGVDPEARAALLWALIESVRGLESVDPPSADAALAQAVDGLVISAKAWGTVENEVLRILQVRIRNPDPGPRLLKLAAQQIDLIESRLEAFSETKAAAKTSQLWVLLALAKLDFKAAKDEVAVGRISRLFTSADPDLAAHQPVLANAGSALYTYLETQRDLDPGDPHFAGNQAKAIAVVVQAIPALRAADATSKTAAWLALQRARYLRKSGASGDGLSALIQVGDTTCAACPDRSSLLVMRLYELGQHLKLKADGFERRLEIAKTMLDGLSTTDLVAEDVAGNVVWLYQLLADRATEYGQDAQIRGLLSDCIRKVPKNTACAERLTALDAEQTGGQ